MLRFCGAVGCWIVMIISVIALDAPAAAADLNFTLGFKEQFITLERKLKFVSSTTGASQTRHATTPQSSAAWMPSVVLNVSSDRWFIGGEVAAGSVSISDQPVDSFSDPTFLQTSNVDLRELRLAIGYTITPGVSPYVGYLQYGQTTDARCTGCATKDELSHVGPGLILAYPVGITRWAAYLNLALIQGFSVEGGLSYAGVRWPFVGVAGFSYQRIDYPANQVSCGQTPYLCYRESDVLSGPVIAVHYIF